MTRVSLTDSTASRAVLPLRGECVRTGERRLRPSDNHIYFEAVARSGSIRKAAQSLHIASSALNRRIHDLEEEVGMALFERLPRGVRLTEAGETLLAYVRWSLKELRRVETQIEQLRGETQGTVRVAAEESVTESLLPRAIVEYQKEHPGVSFQVMVDAPKASLDALARDEVDLIVSHQAQDRSIVSILAAHQHPLCALVAPDHPLAQRREAFLAELAPFPLAMPPRTRASRTVLDRAIAESNLSLRPTLESDSIEFLKSYSRKGQAVCFGFFLSLRDDSSELSTIDLRDPACQRGRMFLATRRGRELPIAAASFAERLKERLEHISSPRRGSRDTFQ